MLVPGADHGLLAAHGFRVLDAWGGYRGEPFGSGPELVVRFDDGAG